MPEQDERLSLEEERRRVYARHDEIVREHRQLQSAAPDDQAAREHVRRVEEHLVELRRLADRLIPEHWSD